MILSAFVLLDHLRGEGENSCLENYHFQLILPCQFYLINHITDPIEQANHLVLGAVRPALLHPSQYLHTARQSFSGLSAFCPAGLVSGL